MLPPAIVIAGPTASGKSALALAVARAFGGCVINADSMQIYDGMRILTARPTEADEALTPHRLYGILSPVQICTAALWRDLAAREAERCWADGMLPVLVGGTGLYLRTIMEGISPIPDIPPDIRDRARALLSEMGNTGFHQMLAARDPEIAARLDAGNSQRLSRAWEVLEATGRSLADWQREPGTGALAARWHTIVLDPPRADLTQSCEARFMRMIEHGALDEARRMAALGLGPTYPATKALGLQDLIAHLEGRRTLDEAIKAAVIGTTRYAKRQATWFRHQIISPERVAEQFSERLCAKIFSNIRQFLLTPE